MDENLIKIMLQEVQKEGVDGATRSLVLREISKSLAPPKERKGPELPERINPAIVADSVLENIKLVTLGDTDEIMYYDESVGYWKEGAEPKILSWLESQLTDDKNKHISTEVIYAIKGKTYIEREKFCPPKNLINLKNGVFNLLTMKLEDRKHENYFRNQVPIVFNTGNGCPAIQKFMEDLVAPEDVNLLVEFFAYCLIDDYPIQKAFMLTGEGENGKSTLLSLLQAFLGKDNCSNVGLVDITENRFAGAQIYGKKANIYPDLPDRELKETGKFKMLTGGDTIMVERKFGHPFNFVNTAKLIFSTNKIPASTDDTNAFFRRWIIINFPKVFDGSNRDPDILSKLTVEEELSGLFNVCMLALDKIMHQKKFSYNASTSQIRDQYVRLSDPVKAFVLDRVMPNMDTETPKDEIYNAYLQYCTENNLVKVVKEVFAKKLPIHIKIENTRSTINEQRVQCWKGMRLFTEEEIKDQSAANLGEPVSHVKAFSYFIISNNPSSLI